MLKAVAGSFGVAPWITILDLQNLLEYVELTILAYSCQLRLAVSEPLSGRNRGVVLIRLVKDPF